MPKSSQSTNVSKQGRPRKLPLHSLRIVIKKGCLLKPIKVQTEMTDRCSQNENGFSKEFYLEGALHVIGEGFPPHLSLVSPELLRGFLASALGSSRIHWGSENRAARQRQALNVGSADTSPNYPEIHLCPKRGNRNGPEMWQRLGRKMLSQRSRHPVAPPLPSQCSKD